MQQLETNLTQQTTEESSNTEYCNELLTWALEALEKNNYLVATMFARICLDKTQWIEQRMACVTLLIIASIRDKNVTESYLKIIYQPQCNGLNLEGSVLNEEKAWAF